MSEQERQIKMRLGWFRHVEIEIKSYLLQKRVLEAKKILESQTDMKVVKVGEKVGFPSFALFNRTFKKITGTTPSSYRNLFIEKSRK